MLPYVQYWNINGPNRGRHLRSAGIWRKTLSFFMSEKEALAQVQQLLRERMPTDGPTVNIIPPFLAFSSVNSNCSEGFWLRPSAMTLSVAICAIVSKLSRPLECGKSTVTKQTNIPSERNGAAKEKDSKELAPMSPAAIKCGALGNWSVRVTLTLPFGASTCE